MDIHYNAFISYRHHPEDIKVAETIHRALERFKVPKALKQQGKKIERIFRDKEELPITSSLTDTITMALRNSDYQIVICSTHLKDSYWVQREIETFLQTHTKDKVLTVLVDGDNPYDVIPEILTYHEVVDPVTGEVTREPIEPLSCDWRMPKRKAMKTELPRLAAVLLGCAYDDLIQRQKQYRQRRLMAGISTGMAASLALAGYFLYSSIQIQENLDRSLRNQSQYLASASGDLFDKGDRLTAISLALAGLPSEDNDRPYVAAAEKALTNALMLYEADGQPISVAAFDAGNSIENFVVSDDGNTLYILDGQYNVTAWDTNDFIKLSTFNILGYQTMDSTLLTDNSGNLLTLGGPEGKTLLCHGSDGSLLWQLDAIEDIAFCSGKETLLAIRKVTSEDYTVPTKYELLTIDPKTGRLTAEPCVMCDNIISSPEFAADTYYEQQPVAVKGYCSQTDGDRVLVFDPVSQTTRIVLEYDGFFADATATEDGKLYVLVSENDEVTNGRLTNYYFYTSAGAYLYCYDIHSGNRLWRTDITSYNYSEADAILPIPGTDCLFCQYGSAFLQVDAKTGKILEECHSTNIPLTLQMRDTYVWVLFTNGCAGSYTFATNTIGYIQYMENGLLKGHSNQGIYVVPQLSSSLLLYRTTSDDSYKVFSGEYEDYINQLRLHENLMATYDFDKLNLFDRNSGQLLWSRELGYSYRLLGFNADGTALYLNKRNTVCVVDTATGESAEWNLLPAEDFADYSMYYDCIGYGSDTVACMIYPYGKTESYLVLADCNTRESTVVPFAPEGVSTDWSSYGYTPIIAELTDTYVLIFAGEGTLFRFDRTDNSVTVLTEHSSRDYVYLIDAENDRMYFRVDEGILITDGMGTHLQTIPLTDLFPVSLFRYEDLLVMLGSDGMVHRFDAEGNHLGRTALSVFSSFFAQCNNIHMQKIPITWAVTPDNELVVNVFRLGNIINTEYWELTADVEQLVCYHEGSDSFICQSNDMIYAYERHSLAETMELAKTALRSFTLSDDQKTAYGLN